MKTYLGIQQCSVFAIIIFNTLFFLNAQNPDNPKQPKPLGQKEYTLDQAISGNAQLHTIAFNGLAFITGSFGADCFFPPGKVSDFFGFQYMRDNDKNELGHNNKFLTRIANNIIYILDAGQLQQAMDLANKQASIYDSIAIKRMVLIKAFRNQMEGNIPKEKKELSKVEVIKFCSELYSLDAELSYSRALVIGNIIYSLSDKQKSSLKKLDFSNSSTWPDLPENLNKKSMTHRAHVCMMTYASELFSWYAGSVYADAYFCPERHGTYFGGFYLKDYPAINDPGYNISTSHTGEKGEALLKALTSEQTELLKQIIQDQVLLLKEVVQIRTDLSIELRKAIANQIPDKEKVFTLIRRYGEIDGEMSYNYAMCFAKINKTLTKKQIDQIKTIRNSNVFPNGTYLFSDPINIPEIGNTDFLFE